MLTATMGHPCASCSSTSRPLASVCLLNEMSSGYLRTVRGIVGCLYAAIETCAAARAATSTIALAAPLAEDVGFVATAGADEVAHVLDDAERRDVELLIHRDGTSAVRQRYLLRRRHDDRAGHRDGLTETERHVAGARRHVDDEIVEIHPLHFAKELLQRAVQHRPSPDD